MEPLEEMIYDVVTSSAVRYVVLGCGAVGGTVAAGLARDGHDVLACDADPAVVEAIGARGLRIEGPVENFTAALPAVLPSDLPDRLDCPVLVAVKAHHTAAAAALLAGRLSGDGFAVSLQNGLTTPVLAATVGPERVVEAVVNFGADMTEPGVVLRGNRATFLVGEPDGRLSGRVRALAVDIAGAVATGGILGYAWAKLAYGAVLAATAVSDLPIAEVLGEPAYRPLLTELARQVVAQAPVPTMPLDGFDASDLPGSLDRLTDFNRASAKTHTGIYRDLAILHRPTEVAAIFGDLTGSLPPLVVDLVRAIEQGRRSCSRENLDLLAACERAWRLGGPLNAVVRVIGAPPRAAAGPLAGRPVAVKDIIEVAGVPTRCGSPASSPEPARADAVVVARLRAAGAEVFAISQCLEYAAGFAHPDVGDTRNPRDPTRTSGGSSGGSAALVAAGACELALGTDTGGSIRIPAAYCGIAGLKPTHGLLPVAGVFPLSPACDHVGTLTATAAGAAGLLAALADPGALTPPTGGDGRFTVGVLAAQLTDPSVTPQVHRAVTGALAALAEAGWRLREITAPWLAELPRWEYTLAVIVCADAAKVHRGRRWDAYAEGTRALLDYGASITGDQYNAAIRQRAELSAAIEASLSGVDVLAGPTVGYQAPEQDPPFGAGADSAESRFTGPYNLTGHPAISIPVPAAGLPIGLQLAGRRGADLALLAAAVAAEELFACARED